MEIAENLEEAQVTAKEIDTTRVKYRARRQARLHPVLRHVLSLSVINTMYENSLNMYLEVFNLTLATSKKDDNLERACGTSSRRSRTTCTTSPASASSRRHKLMLSFQMTIKIQEGEDALNREQLDFFLKGNLSLEKSERKKPHEWWPDQGWEDIMALIATHAATRTVEEAGLRRSRRRQPRRDRCRVGSEEAAAVDDSVRRLVEDGHRGCTAEERRPEARPRVCVRLS